jgi:hypothetical protein
VQVGLHIRRLQRCEVELRAADLTNGPGPGVGANITVEERGSGPLKGSTEPAARCHHATLTITRLA